jgi:hypothetical protein
VDVSARGTARLFNLIPDEVLNVQADGYSLQDINFEVIKAEEGDITQKVSYNALVKDVAERQLL